MTFGGAVELNVTMALSWLPLIGDYTRTTKRPLQIALTSALGYFVGSLFMFMTGLLIVTRTGMTDIASLLTASGLGLVALFIVIFSTVTTTFMDAYSAATNIDNLFHSKNELYWGWRDNRWVINCVGGLDDVLSKLSLLHWVSFYAIVRNRICDLFHHKTKSAKALELRIVVNRRLGLLCTATGC